MKIQMKDGSVSDAHSSGICYRGFEKVLLKRDPLDALVFTCRICGICSITHSSAASLALGNAYNAQMPENACHIRNIALASEMILSHLTHFYMLYMVDFVNRKYAKSKFYKEVEARFSYLKGSSYIATLKARGSFLSFLGLFVGKWPNTLALQPGGVTKAVSSSDIVRALGILAEFKEHIEKTFLNGSIASFLDIKTMAGITDWSEDRSEKHGDLALYLQLARELSLHELGRGVTRLLCGGSFFMPDGSRFYEAGFFNGVTHPFRQDKVTEDVKYSYFVDERESRHPFKGVTESDVDKKGAYSWVKSPRYKGVVVEVGPLARLVVNNILPVADLYNDMGSNVLTRTFARLYEMVLLIGKVEAWLRHIDPEEPFYVPFKKLKETAGHGIIEASRGILGHWIVIENQKIKSYQIVTPTAWNMSPRDGKNNRGAVEQALIGTPVEDEKDPVEVGHVIRSFDPCLFCSVH